MEVYHPLPPAVPFAELEHPSPSLSPPLCRPFPPRLLPSPMFYFACVCALTSSRPARRAYIPTYVRSREEQTRGRGPRKLRYRRNPETIDRVRHAHRETQHRRQSPLITGIPAEFLFVARRFRTLSTRLLRSCLPSCRLPLPRASSFFTAS